MRKAMARKTRALLLAMDVGNTNTGLGVFEGKKLVANWRALIDQRLAADEGTLFDMGRR